MIDATQQAILEAAFEAVATHGYAGATTRRIAQLAGVNEVTLFRKFGTKANLLAEVIRREAETLLVHAVHYTGDLEADLTAIAEGYAALIGRRARALPVLLAELPRHPELQELLQEPLKVLKALLALIARYQAEGRLAGGPPQDILGSLMAPIILRGLLGQFAPGFAPPLDARIHVRRVLEGYDAGKGSPHACD